jgi:phosphatidylserine decarboxylase
MKSLFILLQRILPQHLLSRLAGGIADTRISWIKNPLINLFVAVYGVDLDEAEFSGADHYGSFNEFFTRKLKPGRRPIAGKVSSPADGTIAAIGKLEDDQILQAKGISYSLEVLLAESGAATFRNGSYSTVYLSPRDYHRVHMPVAGTLLRTHYIPGRLFSVNPTTTEHLPNLFTDNERLVLGFETQAGPMCMVMVGAMIVAGIKTVWRDAAYPPRLTGFEEFRIPKPFEQGAEIGQFHMGSTVILIFQEPFDWKAAPGDHIRMGEALVGS